MDITESNPPFTGWTDELENEMISEHIIRGMVGRDLVDRYPERKPDIGEVYFKVEDWTVYHPS